MRAPFARTLPDLLDEQAMVGGGRVAVIEGDRAVTYAELAARARARTLAAALRARGVRRGDRVGILGGNSVAWLDVCFGAGAAGAVVVPVSTWVKAAELEFVLADAGVSVLFAVAEVGGQDVAAMLAGIGPGLPALRETIFLDARYEALFAAEAAEFDLLPGDGPSAADDALILYTSGSTSKSKAVRLAHYGLVENGFNIGERQALGARTGCWCRCRYSGPMGRRMRFPPRSRTARRWCCRRTSRRARRWT